jgi:hypothetical protein
MIKMFRLNFLLLMPKLSYAVTNLMIRLDK